MVKVLVVGRHSGALPDVEVVAQENITWAANSEEVLAQLEDLILRAKEKGAEAILFQATPAQLTSALLWRKLAEGAGFVEPMPMGAIVNKPGPRPAGTQRTFKTGEASTIVEAVLFANPNAKVAQADGEITITVDPPMRFEFSHIEWFPK